MQPDYDVAIIGGGLVGASLAIALAVGAKGSLKVALIEPYPLKSAEEPVYQPSYDARSTALAWGTRLIYEDLGVWPVIADHVTPIKHIHVSEKGQFGITRLHADDYRLPALGYVVENHWIGQSLMARLSALDGIDVLCPDEVEEISCSGEGARLRLREKGDIVAGLAVLADGGRSGLRESLGIDVTIQDYQQTALIANVSSSQHHEWVAYERFTDTGPMALLPLGGRECGEARSAIVWTLPPELAAEFLAMEERAFLSKLQSAFGYRLGKFEKVGERYIYPLKLILSKEQVRPGLAVIGNAAHSLHPVAGQGYNLALRGAMRLAAVLIEAAKGNQPLASMSALVKYLPEQDLDKAITVNFSSILAGLFTNKNPYLSAFLGLGLAGLDVSSLAKSAISRQAMGLAQSSYQFS